MKNQPFSLALALLLPAMALAAPNEGVMTYAGQLLKSDGTAETTPQSLTFSLYQVETGGTAAWTQSLSSGALTAGWFSVTLGGTATPFSPDLFQTQTWLGIKVGSEAEMAPRTKVGAAPHAISMDFTGLSGCAAASQILQWNGAGWNCVATPAGGAGGVSSVSVTAPTPITVSGTTAVSLFMAPASASASGYLSEADWGVFNAKAPIASPTFTGTVTAPTFVGNLSGNATTANSAATATTATTATTANGVAANVVTPSDLNNTVAAGPTAGQVPSKGTSDAFVWVSPLAPPAAACSSTQALSWTGSALSCVSVLGGVTGYANTAPVPFGLTVTWGVAATVTFTLPSASKVLVLGDIFLWGQGPACAGYTRISVDGVGDDTTMSAINVPAVSAGNNGGSVATSRMINSLAAGPHTINLENATNTGMCSLGKSAHINVLVLN
jgi:hypothetical protein